MEQNESTRPPSIVRCPACGAWPMKIEAIDMKLLRPETNVTYRCSKCGVSVVRNEQ